MSYTLPIHTVPGRHFSEVTNWWYNYTSAIPHEWFSTEHIDYRDSTLAEAYKATLNHDGTALVFDTELDATSFILRWS